DSSGKRLRGQTIRCLCLIRWRLQAGCVAAHRQNGPFLSGRGGHFCARGVPFGVQPSGCTDLEQAKACTPCLVWSSAQSSGFGVQPSGCTDSEQAKACTPCLVWNSAQSSGLEFSLQAALTLKQAKACTPCLVRSSAQSSGFGVQ